MRRFHRKTVAKQNQKTNHVAGKRKKIIIPATAKKSTSLAKMTVVPLVQPVILSWKILLRKAISGKFQHFPLFRKFSFNMLILLFQTV